MRLRAIVSIVAAGILFAMCPPRRVTLAVSRGGSSIRGSSPPPNGTSSAGSRKARWRCSRAPMARRPPGRAESKGDRRQDRRREETRFVILDVGEGHLQNRFRRPVDRPRVPFRERSGRPLPLSRPAKSSSGSNSAPPRSRRPRGPASTASHSCAPWRSPTHSSSGRRTPSKSLEAATRASDVGRRSHFCVPNWMRQRSLRQADPLYPYQWHLKNTGEVRGTVAGQRHQRRGRVGHLQGQPGADHLHRGRRPRNRAQGSRGEHRPRAELGFRQETGRTRRQGDHGTACGGVAAARGYNDIGVRGVAPEAGLCGYRIIDGWEIQRRRRGRGRDAGPATGSASTATVGAPTTTANARGAEDRSPGRPWTRGHRRLGRGGKGVHLRLGGRQRPASTATTPTTTAMRTGATPSPWGRPTARAGSRTTPRAGRTCASTRRRMAARDTGITTVDRTGPDRLQQDRGGAGRLRRPRLHQRLRRDLLRHAPPSPASAR